LRERSYSKLLTLEAARLLEAMGAEVKVFNPLADCANKASSTNSFYALFRCSVRFC